MDRSLQNTLLNSFPNSELVGIIREYGSGHSGSPVLAAQYRPTNLRYGLDGTFFIKIGTEQWAAAEQAFYNDASNNALTPLIARFHMSSLPHDGQVAVAYEVAFDSLIAPQPLLSILVEGSQSEDEVHRQIEDLSHALVDWYLMGNMYSHSIVRDLHTLLFHMLTKKRAANLLERLEETLPFWDIGTLQIDVEGLNKRLPNPLVYMRSEAWSKIQHNPNCPIGHVHGDLHSGNIICAPKSGKSPKIIDFDESIADGVPFFDLAYLEFDIVRHLISLKQEEGRKQWLSLLDSSMAAIMPAPETFSLSAARVWRLIQPLRQAVLRLQEPGREDYELVWWLSTVAVGLNFARKGDAKRPQFERIAGLLYAAYRLDRIFTMLRVHDLIKKPALIVPWIEGNFPTFPSSDVTSQTTLPEHSIEALPVDEASPEESSQESTSEDLPEEVSQEPIHEVLPVEVAQPTSTEASAQAAENPVDAAEAPVDAGVVISPEAPAFFPPEQEEPITVEQVLAQCDEVVVSTSSAEIEHSGGLGGTESTLAEMATKIQTGLKSSIEIFKIGGVIDQKTCDTTNKDLQELESFLNKMKEKTGTYNYQILIPLGNVLTQQKNVQNQLLNFRECCPPLNRKELSLASFHKECTLISEKLEDLQAKFLELLPKF